MISTARIRAIAELVGNCDSIIDVGCDHGYLGIYLLANKLANRVTFVDRSKIALSSAKQNVAKYLPNFINQANFQISDGFKALSQTLFYDNLVITGLGATNIIRIIEDGNNKIHFGIFGPQGNVSCLRSFLNSKHISIIDEKIIFEHGFFYEFIKVDFHKKTARKYSKIEELIGPILIKKNEILLRFYWQKKLNFLMSLSTKKNNELIKLIKQFLDK